jgi:hypothetical protein
MVLTSCTGKNKQQVADNTESEKAGAPDYSDRNNWMKQPAAVKDVDVFYVYPTEYIDDSEGAPIFADINEKTMREPAQETYQMQATAYEESANVFVPYYRQVNMAAVSKLTREEIYAAFDSIPKNDVFAALDYYFEHYNEGRPFIIAGHSQGAAILRLVLMNYFREHPDRYERMVAAYAIGFSITKNDLDASPHLKFATGETDTCVVISWNTEGPKNVEANTQTIVMKPGAISINPLNWKLDETYAPASENLGSLVMDLNTGATKISDIGADAQVNIARGTVVTNADAIPNEMVDFAGPQNYHQDDYSIFFNNVKDNVVKRIAAYKAKQ